MAAGVFGYMGYDTVRLVEHLPNVPPDVLGVPDAILMRPTLIVIFDSVKDEMTVVTPVRPAPADAPHSAYAAARERLASVVAALEAPLPHAPVAAHRELPPPSPSPTPRQAEFIAHGGKAKEYIAAGDVFQIVLSQRFSAPFTLPPFSLYRALRRTNPSPFLFHLDLGGFALVGSSPEILVRVRKGEVTIRPLAGTRPRGATPARGPGAGGGAARRSQGARRAPDAARPRPQRRRPRRRDRLGRGDRAVRRRALQPRHAHRLATSSAGSIPGTTRSTR